MPGYRDPSSFIGKATMVMPPRSATYSLTVSPTKWLLLSTISGRVIRLMHSWNALQKNQRASADKRSVPYTGTVNRDATVIRCSIWFELRRTRVGSEVMGEYLSIYFTKNLRRTRTAGSRHGALEPSTD